MNGKRLDYLEKYFTLRGVMVLEERLLTLVKLHAKTKEEDYPIDNKMLGFPNLHLHSKKHTEGMIDDLCQILAINKEDIQVEVKTNGS